MFRCIEYISRFEPTLSYSGENAFKRCPRLYYLAYIVSLQTRWPFLSDALKIGKIVDEALTQGSSITTSHNDTDTNTNSIWYTKVQAILTAFHQLFPDVLDGYEGQKEWWWQDDGFPQVHGFIDLSASDHFVELKCTSRPEYYSNPYSIHDQVGTYFLSNSNYEYGIIWAIRTPALRQTGNFKDECFEDYKDRCIRDILKRPAYYFSGYNKETNSFGVKFYRSEFDLDALRDRYKWIVKLIKECAKANYWYQNRTQCLYPFKCDYLNICETGGISEDIYTFRHSGNGGSLANRTGNAGEQPVTHKA